MKGFLTGLDWWIIIAVIVLCGFSLAVLSSVASSLAVYQLVFILIGFILLFLFANFDFRVFMAFWPIIYAISVFLLLVTFVLGIESHGAVRWFEIAGFRIQWSELLKPFLLTVFASFLASHPPTKLKNLLGVIIFALVPIFLILRQPDLGSATVYFLSFMPMVFVAGVPVSYIVGLTIAAALASPVFFQFLHGYQRTRILSFLNPSKDPLGSSYNAIQAVIAVGSGMLTGKGLGHGTQSQLAFLPERHTDFVFASFAEEFGLFGSLLLLAAYLVIFWRILRLLSANRDIYTVTLLTGLLFIVGAQMFINIGMNTGVLPITGITLPLVSYGGSSVISTMIILGIVENIAKQTVENS